MSTELPPFEGEWTSVLHFARNPPGRLTGRASFERLDGSGLLVMRSSADAGGPPTSVAVIGSDERSGRCTMLYWDDRGVSRTYDMTWDGHTWTLSCHTTYFFQRFEATLSADANELTGAWWASDDATNWNKDFDITYRRA